MTMFVTACPAFEFKNSKGEYTMVDYLFFRRREAAEAWLNEQPFHDGKNWFEVPAIHKGLYVRHGDILRWWTPDLLEQAEDYAGEHDLKLIEFNRSWLE